MKFYNKLLEYPIVYRAWMAPFAEKKLRPLHASTDVRRARRVLDVGCGPGTNTPHFRDADYLGIDYNPSYIESARRRYGRSYVVADVTKFEVPAEERFDLILANSLFHHLETSDTRRILAHLGTLLSPDGFVHIVDLVLPPRASIPRFLARADRGDHPRPLAEWRELFETAFEPVVFEQFPVGAGGVELWSMVYFKGRARQ
jgi:SAM-dependent methyltransferase